MPDGNNAFKFEPAVRVNTAIVLALAGASGSGKTKSALELAVGLAGQSGKILIVDSEGGRAKHYADEYQFYHYDWRPPYSPKALGEILQEGERQGFAVIVVDSMSSEHEDEGGLCDMAEAALETQRGENKNSAAAWARPKAEHKRHIVRWLRQARCHVIFCLRATEKVKFERIERNGKTVTAVVPVGWTPIAEKNLLYDVTTSLLFTPDNPGVPQAIKLYDKHKPFFPIDRRVTREAGRALAEWAAGGASVSDPYDGAYQVAARGTEAFRAWWKTITRQQRDALKSELGGLQKRATEADAETHEADDEDPFGLSPIEQPPAGQPQQENSPGTQSNEAAHPAQPAGGSEKAGAPLDLEEQMVGR